MSVSTELERIQVARNKLRAKATELAIAEGTAKLDELATAFDGIVNNGSVSATVQEGDTYTIPKGYHNGSGTVSGVAGGGNYNLQSKTVTPTKQQQNVTPDGGYYGLSDVTVEPIPANYQDVSSVTATEAEVLATKVFVDSTGKVKTGTMPNNGAVTKTLDGKTTSFPIPAGYHNGAGSVSIVPETTSATPITEPQTVTPTTGKVLTQVTVEAIPANYKDVATVTAVPEHVLQGDVYVNSEGQQTGTMPNNGGVSQKLDTTTKSYTVPAGYHNGQGTVSIDTEEKTATPTKAPQNVTPTAGKVLSKVTVEAIPSEFVDTSDADALAAEILDGKFAYVDGEKREGTMPNNGAVNGSFDGMTVTSFSVPAGYTSGGTVSLTNDIETALAAI